MLFVVQVPIPAQSPTENKAPAAAAADLQQELTAQPNPALPGQTVNIRLPFGTVRARIAGGRFGKGQTVKDTTRLADTPKQTTSYSVDLWTAGAAEPIHQDIQVEVSPGVYAPLTTYRHPTGWKLDYPKGWKVIGDPTPGPDGGFVLFFAPDEESIERLAVAVLRSDAPSPSDLMRKVAMEVPNQYDIVPELQRWPTTHLSMPADWMTFSAENGGTPGTPMRSIVMALVGGGHGYVISARTRSDRFVEREHTLHALVRSFMPPPEWWDQAAKRAGSHAVSGGSRPETNLESGGHSGAVDRR